MSLYVDAGLSDEVLEDAATILGGILTLEKRGRSAIAKEAKTDEAIMQDFFLFHLEEVPDCLPETVRTAATKEAFVEALTLVGVALHGDDKAAFQIVLDYGYGRDYSDQLLAVKFGPDREIWEVSHES